VIAESIEKILRILSKSASQVMFVLQVGNK